MLTRYTFAASNIVRVLLTQLQSRLSQIRPRRRPHDLAPHNHAIRERDLLNPFVLGDARTGLGAQPVCDVDDAGQNVVTCKIENEPFHRLGVALVNRGDLS